MADIENLKNNKAFKQVIAWIFLLVLVWIVGTWFLNAIGTGEQTKPSEKLNVESEEQSKQPEKQSSSSAPAGRYIGEIQILQQGVNLRSEPKKGDNVIKTLNNNSVWPVISKTDDWYEVMVDGEKGYVTTSTRYVKVVSMSQ